MNQNVEKSVYEIIKRIGNINDEKKMELDVCLIEDLGFDSIKMITLIVEIENEFGIEFDDDDLDIKKLDLLENIINIIMNKLELKEKKKYEC